MSSVRLSLHVLLLCGFLRAQQLLLPGSCNFELGTCGYISDPEYGSWSMNEEGHLITVDSAFLQDQEQSVSWMRAMVDYHCDVRHQIIFEAIRGPTLRSDIAIDDIHFKRGPCEDPGDITPYSGFSEYFNEIEN